ncbi:hypothetical protein JOM56_013093 [Amanita muscaria]
MSGILILLQLSTDDPYEAEPVDMWGMSGILYLFAISYSPEFRKHALDEVFDDPPRSRMSSDRGSRWLRLVISIEHNA